VRPELAVSKLVAAKGIAVVYLDGYLNGHGTWMVDAAIHQLAGQESTTAVLDLAGVYPVSCHGVRWLLESIQSWRQQGVRLVLCAMRPSCRAIFDLLGEPPPVEIFRDRETAVARAKHRSSAGA